MGEFQEMLIRHIVKISRADKDSLSDCVLSFIIRVGLSLYLCDCALLRMMFACLSLLMKSKTLFAVYYKERTPLLSERI